MIVATFTAIAHSTAAFAVASNFSAEGKLPNHYEISEFSSKTIPVRNFPLSLHPNSDSLLFFFTNEQILP